MNLQNWTADQLIHILGILKNNDPRVGHVQELTQYLAPLFCAIQDGTAPPIAEFTAQLQTGLLKVDRTGPGLVGSIFTHEHLVFPELATHGPEIIHITTLKKAWHMNEKLDNLTAGAMLEYLTHFRRIENCLSWFDLKALEKRGAFFFRRYFKGRRIFAWKSVTRHCGLDVNRDEKTYWKVPVLWETNKDSLSIGWLSLTELLKRPSDELILLD